MDVLLVLKPHFAQDVSEIKDLKLSNIRFIDDAFFRLHGITSYEFVAGCDAMITDYSSIYYDYLLCDRPVGLVWEDLEEYRAKPGFAVDIEEYCAGGVKIYDLADFKEFLQQVALDQDVCQQARRRLRDMTNYSTDGQNAQRVTDFIIEKANL
jgi:CDP-glycerol glycerophosphotransferase (TagB/SpsB family)